MTVLQINVVYDEKSTGRNCKEIERFLEDKGIRCFTAYGVGGKDKGSNAYRIDTKPEYYVHNILSRLTGLEGYFSYFATKRLLRYIKRVGPDVIHIHNLHGHYLNLPILFRFLKETQIPIVQNLHDCWIFTGKCTHPVKLGCEKWKCACEVCPAKKKYPESWLFDFSKKMYADKVKFFNEINVRCVIGVSSWIADQARMSFLGAYPVKYIYNWIDTEVFRPYPSKDIFDEYGIAKDKYTVICVAAAWKENTAKTDELIQLANLLGNAAQVVVVGKCAEAVAGENVVPIGFVSDTAGMAQLYSASDVYVHVSHADTFGKVIAEAMACGTPAVAYDCTACSELIQPGCGLLVPLHDVNALYNAVCEIRHNGKQYYSTSCIDRVNRDFDYNQNCQMLLDLYKGGCNDADDKG